MVASKTRGLPYLQGLQSNGSIQLYHVVGDRMVGIWMNPHGKQETSIKYLRSRITGWHLSAGNIWVGGFLAVWRGEKESGPEICCLDILFQYPQKTQPKLINMVSSLEDIFFSGHLLLSYYIALCLETSPNMYGFVESDFTLRFWKLLHWWSIELLMVGRG